MRAENVRIAKLHAQEVEEKLFLEEQYKVASGRWQAQRDDIMRHHEKDVARAKEAHAENIEGLQQEWQARKEEVGGKQGASEKG